MNVMLLMLFFLLFIMAVIETSPTKVNFRGQLGRGSSSKKHSHTFTTQTDLKPHIKDKNNGNSKILRKELMDGWTDAMDRPTD